MADSAPSSSPIAHWYPQSPAKALHDDRRSAHVHPEYLLTIKLLPDTCNCQCAHQKVVVLFFQAQSHALARFGVGTVAMLCMNPLDLLQFKFQLSTCRPKGDITCGIQAGWARMSRPVRAAGGSTLSDASGTFRPLPRSLESEPANLQLQSTQAPRDHRRARRFPIPASNHRSQFASFQLPDHDPCHQSHLPSRCRDSHSYKPDISGKGPDIHCATQLVRVAP